MKFQMQTGLTSPAALVLSRLSRGNELVTGGMGMTDGRNGIHELYEAPLRLTRTPWQLLLLHPAGKYSTVIWASVSESCGTRDWTACHIFVSFRSHTTAIRAPVRVAS